MKVVKFLVRTVVIVLALVLVLLLTLPLWIGPVATTAANKIVPGITGTEFTLGKFALNPYSGNLEVGELDLSNPTNFSEKTAAKLGSLKVGVAVGSLAKNVIHVREVTLDGLYVYLSGLTAGNFQQIADHAAGDRDAKAEEKPAGEKSAEEGEGKKVWLESLTLKGIELKIGAMPAIPVPTIALHDIGKPKDETDEGGVTMQELWTTVSGKVLESANALGDAAKVLGGLMGGGAKALGGLVGDGAGAVGEGAAKAAGALGDGAKALGGLVGDGAGAVGAGAGKAVGAVGEGAGKAVGAVGEGAGKAVGAVGEGAAKAAEAVGDTAGKAVDAVGEGAAKAADAIKGLFK